MAQAENNDLVMKKGVWGERRKTKVGKVGVVVVVRAPRWGERSKVEMGRVDVAVVAGRM